MNALQFIPSNESSKAFQQGTEPQLLLRCRQLILRHLAELQIDLGVQPV
jgi:hypothetical protein